MFNRKNSISLMLLLVSLMLLAVTGCGGDDSASNRNDSGNDSTVALFLADGPADDFDHIWIEVSEISLLPKDDGAPVVIYETDNPTRIDLLTLQDDDLLLTVNSSIPSGTYHRIRMVVEHVEGQQEGQTIDLKLSSNKIDLNPTGPIDVTPGETLSLRLDIDADKSIHVSSGPNYNFRPVVFVDAGPMENPYPCHHMVKGEIAELLYEEQEGEQVIGFRMAPFDANNTLDVYFQDDVIIFNDNGKPTGPETLAIDQIVCISGELDPDGRFLASVVVIGQVQTISGIVETAVDDENQFQVNAIIPGNYMMSDQGMMTVALSDGTIIMLGDTEAGADQIQPDQKARIAGKIDSETGTFNAIAVFLKPQQIRGTLTAIAPAESGHLLTINTHMRPPHDIPPINDSPEDGNRPKENNAACYAEEEITVFLPESASIEVKGGKTLTGDDLSTLVQCDPPQVQVLIGSEASEEAPAQASALYVLPQMVMMTVGQIDPDTRIITANAAAAHNCIGNTQTLYVAEGTPIWVHNDAEQTPIEFGAIQVGDFLMVAALKTCEPTDYDAVVVIKAPECDIPGDPDDPCMPRHERIEMIVAGVNIDATASTIEGEDGTSVLVTERTILIDKTQTPPQKVTLSDLEAGDALICEILVECNDEPGQAILIVRVDPDSEETEPDPDICKPDFLKMEAVVETAADDAILTTGSETVKVPPGTPIFSKSKNGIEKLTLADLVSDDVLEIMAIQTCGENPGLTALMIIKHIS